MFLEQVHEYLSDYKFWAGVLGGLLFSCAFVIVFGVSRANKQNDWWTI